MLNLIKKEQNTQRQINRIAASSVLYSQAKSWLLVQFILAVPITILFSFLVIFIPNFDVWAAFYGICVSILDAAIIDNFQKYLRQQAAKIQELFDCDIFHLEWNFIKVGNRPDAESITRLAKSFKEKNSKSIESWYPPIVENVPLSIAIIICQRSNSWWDLSLRKTYLVWIITIICSIIVTDFIIGISIIRTLDKFILASLAPLSPAILWAVREYRQQNEAIEQLERLKEFILTLFEQAINQTISSDKLEREIREVQDGIYENRCNNPMIFNWIYKLLRNSQEEAMNKGAEELVQEALQALNSTK